MTNMLKQDFHSIFTDFRPALPEGMITESGLDERFLSKRCRVLWFTARDKSTKADSANTANENNKKLSLLQFHKAIHVASLRSKGYI